MSNEDYKYKNVVTFGTFDLFHIGHLRLLQRAADFGEKLIVGVSSDQLNFEKKEKYPEFSEFERIEIIKMIKGVDIVFVEESLELKRSYLLRYNADLLLMGNDWEGRFDEFKDICDVKYVERTPLISTTVIIEKLKG